MNNITPDHKKPLTREEMEKQMAIEDPTGIKTVELATKFMFAMSYYHKRATLHASLHPVFFLAGFLIAYYFGKGN